MQFIKDQGFIIKRRNFGEADRILTIFSKDNGKITVVAKGVRKISSKRGALLEPFNLIKFHAVKPYSMPVLTEVQLISPFEAYKSNLENYKKILIVCELIDALCAEDVKVAGLYDDLLDFAYKKDENSSMLDFKTKMLANLGYWNLNKKFLTEEDSYRYIESIIERKIKSRTITF